MAVYNNISQTAPIRSVEFAEVPQGNIAFFQVSSEDAPAISELLTRQFGQSIITRAQVAGGKTMFVTQGPLNDESLLKQLSGTGNDFKLQVEPEKSKFNAWKLRGELSTLGQPLQLLSATWSPGGLAMDRAAFAGINMAANVSNMAFGSQKREDVNRGIYVKTKFNEAFKGEFLPGNAPIAIDTSRSDLREEPAKRKSVGAKTYGFMKDYSVVVCEIGLRFAGASALFVPFENWGKVARELSYGNPLKAMKVGLNPNKLPMIAGAGYLGGKTLALISKTPDKYSPEKHTALDTFREKYVFRLSSIIEFSAASALLVHSLQKGVMPTGPLAFSAWKNRTAKGLETRDYAGIIGSAAFAGGQAVRFFAPFGELKPDVQDTIAYVGDSLALMPKDKLPELMAKSTAFLQEQFSEQHLDFGKVYTQMQTDLYRYHNIAVDSPSASAQIALEPSTNTPAHPILNTTSMSKPHESAAGPHLPAAKDARMNPGKDGFTELDKPQDFARKFSGAAPRPASHQDAVTANRNQGVMAGVA